MMMWPWVRPSDWGKIVIKMEKNSGMTLVEVLVVIAIIAVLSIVSGTFLLKYGPVYELRSAARSVYAELQNAKISAIRSKRSWGVVFTEANSTMTIFSNSGADGNFTATADNTFFKSVNLGGFKYGVQIGHGNATTQVGGGGFGAGDDVTFAGDLLVFDPRGTSNPGFVYVQNERGESHAIVTQQFGNVMIRRWTGAGWE